MKIHPRIQNTSQNSKTLPRIQNTSQNPKQFWILGLVLYSGTCFWILGCILDSGMYFHFWEVFCLYEPQQIWHLSLTFAMIIHIPASPASLYLTSHSPVPHVPYLMSSSPRVPTHASQCPSPLQSRPSFIHSH